MDPDVVKRVKTVWLVAWLGVTGVAFLGWGFKAAAVVSVGYVVASIMGFIAFFLNLLLGEEHVAFRILLIVLFLLGLAVEICGIASIFR